MPKRYCLIREATARDPSKAADLYRQAAAQDEAVAQYNLAQMYYQGRGGLVQNKQQAASFFRKAAEQGHARAQEEVDQENR